MCHIGGRFEPLSIEIFMQKLTASYSSPTFALQKEPSLEPAKSYSYFPKKSLTIPPSPLISEMSREISEEVSYVPVLDRLTCDYVLPEATNLLRSSKSVDVFHLSDSFSSVIKDSFPDDMSYTNMKRFYRSPQHQVRLRGSSPTFELKTSRSRSVPRLTLSEQQEFMEDFLKRDAELRDQKDALANSGPPPIPVIIDAHSQEIAIRAREKQKIQEVQLKIQSSSSDIEQIPEPEITTPTKKTPTKPVSMAKTAPTTTPQQFTDIPTNVRAEMSKVRMFFQKMEEIKTMNDSVDQQEEKEQRERSLHMARTDRLAKRAVKRKQQKVQADANAKAAELEQARLNATTKKKPQKPPSRKLPSYMDEIIKWKATLDDNQRDLLRVVKTKPREDLASYNRSPNKQK